MNTYETAKFLTFEIDELNSKLEEKKKELQKVLQCDWEYQSMDRWSNNLISSWNENPNKSWQWFSLKAAQELQKILEKKGYILNISGTHYSSEYKLNLVTLKILNDHPDKNKPFTTSLSRFHRGTPIACLEDCFE